VQQRLVHSRWQWAGLLLGRCSRLPLLLLLLLLLLLQLCVAEAGQQRQQLSQQSFRRCHSTPLSRLPVLLVLL
jgi:hypothetical protein